MLLEPPIADWLTPPFISYHLFSLPLIFVLIRDELRYLYCLLFSQPLLSLLYCHCYYRYLLFVSLLLPYCYYYFISLTLLILLLLWYYLFHLFFHFFSLHFHAASYFQFHEITISMLYFISIRQYFLHTPTHWLRFLFHFHYFRHAADAALRCFMLLRFLHAAGHSCFIADEAAFEELSTAFSFFHYIYLAYFILIYYERFFIFAIIISDAYLRLHWLLWLFSIGRYFSSSFIYLHFTEALFIVYLRHFHYIYFIFILPRHLRRFLFSDIFTILSLPGFSLSLPHLVYRLYLLFSLRCWYAFWWIRRLPPFAIRRFH